MKKQLILISSSIQRQFPSRIARAEQASYRFDSLVLQFFAYAFTGWFWEVLLHAYMDHAFVNRGVLTGPWLPIYGAGGILILVLLRRFRSRPLKLFGISMVLAGLIEYMTATALDMLFHQKWWDYSGMLFQLHGKVCLAGLLLFAFGGCFVCYVAAPFLDRQIQRIALSHRRFLVILLLSVFALDTVFSLIHPNTGAGITYPHLLP
ncbi:hypothetical protein K280104A7_07020 [Candidatus Bariatricus faecipullorum]